MRDNRTAESGKSNSEGDKRPYHSPVLTEYGSVEDLVDAGVVLGTVPTVPLLILTA